jgi:hypothetical protein
MEWIKRLLTKKTLVSERYYNMPVFQTRGWQHRLDEARKGISIFSGHAVDYPRTVRVYYEDGVIEERKVEPGQPLWKLCGWERNRVAMIEVIDSKMY